MLQISNACHSKWLGHFPTFFSFISLPFGTSATSEGPAQFAYSGKSLDFTNIGKIVIVTLSGFKHRRVLCSNPLLLAETQSFFPLVLPKAAACKLCLFSHVQLFGAYQALLSTGFPPPGDLPDPGFKPGSPASPALSGGFYH